LREAFGRRIGLIALTSLQSVEDRARSLQAGFDVHLVKPAMGEDLFRAIHALSAA
jgi:DNA-binding response OmpR family regulator